MPERAETRVVMHGPVTSGRAEGLQTLSVSLVRLLWQVQHHTFPGSVSLLRSREQASVRVSWR